jgi:hypothetical protein
MKPQSPAILLLCLLLSFAALGQTRKPITNEDIANMVKLGFEETTIIKTVQANEPGFDTSVEGLLALKNAGVSKAVIDAMLDVQSAANARPDPFGGLPRSAGVYYRGGAGWMQLQDAPAPRTVSKGLIGAITSLGKTKVTYVYRGAHAPVQLQENQPVFYIRGVSKFGRDAEIIRLECKSETREVDRASDSALWGTSASDGTALAVNVTRIASDALVVAPTAPLKDGEYLLSLDADHNYDFGIASGR